MKVYGHPWSINTRKTLMTLAEKQHEAELSLVDLPRVTTGLAIPFAALGDALGFVVRARESDRSPLCLELFDRQALTIAGESSGRSWPDNVDALVYVEDDALEDALVDEALSRWLEIAEGSDALGDHIRVYQGAAELRDARVMRHSVPATMNERGARHRASGGRKVSTDWAVPYRRLGEALHESAVAVERHKAPHPVTYGHAGNGHPHQNFIAEDEETLGRINAAVHETLQRIIAMGGTVSAEHGLGKIKRHWMPLQLSALQIEVMRQIKHALDPHGLFSPGNIFE